MKLSLEMYGVNYSVETKQNDFSVNEMKEMYSKLLCLAGYDKDVIEQYE